MQISNKREPTILFIGDLIIMGISLWIMLFFRNMRIPENSLFLGHLLPFLMIFGVSVLVFYIAGLYEKHTVILKSRLPHIIFRAEIINSTIAVMFFYFVPYFGISPKTNLFIYVVISFLLIVFWRIWLSSFFIVRRAEPAMLIGQGKELEELSEEINKNPNYGLRFVSIVNLDNTKVEELPRLIERIIKDSPVSIVVVDLEHDMVREALPILYKLIFSKVRFVAMYKVYEDVFKRVPFSILQYNWFIENISASPKIMYNTFKHVFDFVFSLLGGIVSLLFYPFVILAIKMEDGGPVFISQERIGKGGKQIYLYKFRSMKNSDRGVWVTEDDDRITRVGSILRKTRIDELPQLWNVVKGDISLIGPRPDIYDLGKQLEQQIPYYTVRSVISPGLSGWAQVSQELPPQSLEETKVRLAYDLYYVKNRSIILDVRIILKTVRTLLSRTGK